MQQALAYFEELPIEFVADTAVARTKGANRQPGCHTLTRRPCVEVLIAHTPCWTSPNLVVRGIQHLNLPTLCCWVTSTPARTAQ